MIESFIKKLNSESKEVIIVGDLNCNMLDSSNFAMKNADLLNINQLTQLIVKPTKVTQTTSTLLDFCVTSLPEKINTYSDVFPIGVNDHNLIFVVCKINTCSKKWEFIRLLKLGISNSLILVHFKKTSYLSHWIFYLDNEVGIDSKWCLWRTLCLNVLDAHAPLKMKRI